MSDPGICKVFWITTFLVEQDDAVPLNALPSCYERRLDEHWFIAVNGHEEPRKTKGGISIRPYYLYVEFNGWPAGTVHPYGGEFAAGSLANEETFIEACEKALGKTLKELTADLTAKGGP